MGQLAIDLVARDQRRSAGLRSRIFSRLPDSRRSQDRTGNRKPDISEKVGPPEDHLPGIERRQRQRAILQRPHHHYFGVGGIDRDTCGGRSPCGQPGHGSPAASRCGVRASITCSIAPRRAPAGSRSPASSMNQRPSSHRRDHVGDGLVSFFGDEELHLAQAGGPEAGRAAAAWPMPNRIHSSLRSSAQPRAVERPRRSSPTIDGMSRSSPARTSMAGAPFGRVTSSRVSTQRHRDEIELLVEGGIDLREQHRVFVAFGFRGFEHAAPAAGGRRRGRGAPAT